MREFDMYNMRGITAKDNKAILEMIDRDIEMTVDEYDRVFNEGGQYIADMIEAPENGVGFEYKGGKKMYFEMLDYAEVRSRNGYTLFLGTCGEEDEWHAITQYGIDSADFKQHDSIQAVAEKWNKITGDNAEGFDLAWKPNYSSFDHLERLAGEIETEHNNGNCNHDGPCEHIVALAQFLADHKDEKEDFENWAALEWPMNIFEKFADIDEHPEDWIGEKYLKEWNEEYAPKN